jgi:hypothetical protein
MLQQQTAGGQHRSYQGPIVVSGDDYDWDQQRSDPRHPHINENANANVNVSATTVPAARARARAPSFGLSSHWDQHRKGPRRPKKGGNANAAAVPVARTPVTGMRSHWDQSAAPVPVARTPSLGLGLISHTANTDSFTLANLSIAEGAADGASQRKDAAKTAATYYGECYLEGVEMSHADKAARESHDRYKKWWLQERESNGIMHSFGDGMKVPMFNPPSSSPLPLTAPEEQVAMKHKSNEKMGQTFVSYYTVDDSATLDAPKSHSGPELMMNAARVFDRSSGASHPSPVDNASFLSNQQFDATAPPEGYLSGESMNSSGKKRQRSLTGSVLPQAKDQAMSTDETICISNRLSLRAPYHQSRSKPRELTTAKNRGHGIDPYATTDDEAAGGMTNHTMEPRLPPCGFERARSKRLEQQRRRSSFCEYEYAPQPRRSSPLRRSVLDKRKGAQGYKKRVENVSSKSVERHPSIDEEGMHRCADNEKYDAIMTSIMPPVGRTAKHIDNAKLELLRCLAISGGDITNKPFLFALEQLRALYVMNDFDARFACPEGDKHLEGNWLTISRPNFNECLGTNTNGDYMYTLGRMSFDMFAPGNLVCSISGIFNSIQVESSEKCIRSVPKSLRDEVTKGNTILRRYEYVLFASVEFRTLSSSSLPYINLFSSSSVLSLHLRLSPILLHSGLILPTAMSIGPSVV